MKNLQLARRVLDQIEVDPERFESAALAASDRGCVTASIGGHVMLLAGYRLNFTARGPVFSRPSGTTVVAEEEEIAALLGLSETGAQSLAALQDNEKALSWFRHLIEETAASAGPSPLHPRIIVQAPPLGGAGDLIRITTRKLRAKGLDRDLFAYERDVRSAIYPEVVALTMQLVTVR